MKASEERMADLLARGENERVALAVVIGDMREELDLRKTQLRIAGWIAGGIAAGLTAAYKLFGKRSLAATVGRYSSAASLLLGLVRGALRLRRFFF